MAKAVVRARRSVRDGACDQEPLKVIYSKKEPARTYVWGHPNGGYYVWDGCKWVPRTCDHHKKHYHKCCKYVEKSWAESRLERLKRELVEKFRKIINKGGSSSDLTQIQEQIDAINNEIDRLNDVDSAVNTELDNLNNVDTVTNERLETLEAQDHSHCITAVDV